MRLKVTSQVAETFDLFPLSLSALAKGVGEPMMVFPTMGKPLPFNKPEPIDVFVLMPFRDEMRHIYSDHVKVVAESLGMSCKCVDEFSAPNSIIQEIWSSIYFADICIADCTGRNPNVFYELVIAHTLGRSTIILAQSIDDIPFDIRQYRTVVYSTSDLQQFDKKLRMTLEEIRSQIVF